MQEQVFSITLQMSRKSDKIAVPHSLLQSRIQVQAPLTCAFGTWYHYTVTVNQLPQQDGMMEQ
jgi:hypothetical protein